MEFRDPIWRSTMYFTWNRFLDGVSRDLIWCSLLNDVFYTWIRFWMESLKLTNMTILMVQDRKIEQFLQNQVIHFDATVIVPVAYQCLVWVNYFVTFHFFMNSKDVNFTNLIFCGYKFGENWNFKFLKMAKIKTLTP